MQTYTATQKGPLRIAGYLDPDDKTLITVYWGAPVFAANTVYRVGDICRPTTDNGYYYTCTTAGKSAASEPSTWSQSTQTSGTAVFEAVNYDLWVLPSEQLQAEGLVPASEWTASELVTLSSESNDTTTTSVLVSDIPVDVTEFELTNQVRKTNGEILSRTFKYRVNHQ